MGGTNSHLYFGDIVTQKDESNQNKTCVTVKSKGFPVPVEAKIPTRRGRSKSHNYLFPPSRQSTSK